MATLNYQNAKPGGTAITFSAASGGGDKVKPNDRGGLVVRNGSGGSINVTLVVPGNTKYAQAEPDVVIAVADGAQTVIGPLPSDLKGGDGLVAFTYSGTSSVTVAAVAF